MCTKRLYCFRFGVFGNPSEDRSGMIRTDSLHCGLAGIAPHDGIAGKWRLLHCMGLGSERGGLTGQSDQSHLNGLTMKSDFA